MKFVLYTIFRSFLIIVAWLFCIYKCYIDFDHEYWMDDIVHGQLLILAGVVSIVCIYFDYKKYHHYKKSISFLSTLCTVLCVTGLLMMIGLLKKQDRTQPFLFASNHYKGAYLWFEFRKNGTYKCGKSAGFFSDTYFIRGQFKIRDSIIYLDRNSFHNISVSDRLLMKTIPQKIKSQKRNLLNIIFAPSRRDTTPDTFLYPISHNGNFLDSSMTFKVNKNILFERVE